RVKKGQVLARLDSFDLEKELRGLRADMYKAEQQKEYLSRQVQQASTSQAQPGAMDYIQTQAQLAEATITAKSSKQRIEIVEEQIESMKIRSPQEGIVTTWEVKRQLMGRPVDYGTELLQVAATDGEWILEVEVPDDDMGPVLAAKHQLEEDIKAGR